MQSKMSKLQKLDLKHSNIKIFLKKITLIIKKFFKQALTIIHAITKLDKPMP